MNPNTFLLPVVAVLGIAAASRAGTVTLDGTSGASINVTTRTSTSSSFSVAWTYNKSNGTWRIYYGTSDVAAPTTTGWATTVTPSGKSSTITGLQPGTQYYALVAGWEGGVGTRAQSWAHFSFKTDPPASVVDRPAAAARPGQGYDAFGRRLGRIPAAGPDIRLSRGGGEVHLER